MSPIVIILIVLVILALSGGLYAGRPVYAGGGVGLILVILLILYLAGVFR